MPKKQKLTDMGNSGFVLSFLVSFTFSLLLSVCGDTELRALLEVKASLDPENKLLKSWTENGDPCSGSFKGIGCNEHREVANISLQGKGLSGKLSPAFSSLKSLSGLYLHYNNLSGEIPKEIANLTHLTDLYLDVNDLSGSIPPEIGHMTNLQVLQLCCNQLTGNLPAQIRSLKSLSVLTLQHNRLTGEIPTSLGNLGMLSRLDLGFNSFFGPIPRGLALNPRLEVLDVQNNTLTGIVPPGLKRLNGRFQCQNNPGLCGVGFVSLRVCTAFDNMNINQVEPFGSHANNTASIDIPESTNYQAQCNQTHCLRSSKLPKVFIVAGVVTITFTLAVTGFLTLFRYRRQKQKIGNTKESSEGRLSTDLAKELNGNGASPLVSLEYIHGWDPLGHGLHGSGFYQEQLNNFRFNLEEVEYATQCFSEVNLLGRSNFSCVYKGILRGGSVVAIRSISVTSCKSEEAEFVKGLNLLNSIRHENIVRLRGFCCSRGRGECFLIYDFIPKGKLSRYLDVDVETGNTYALDWSTRVSIILGIAKGIAYLHGSELNKPAIVHRNISVEKILLDQQFNPLIADCSLHKLLADDIVFLALKTSAAMGYLAPEYVTTGHFTEKSDVFAFGVIILQILSSRLLLSSSMRVAAESGIFENFIDKNLKGNFSESEAAMLGKIALACTQELPENRPSMEAVVEELTIGTAAPVMATFLFRC
ncbi:probable LRR receptor-like serine/threonine-protein kinase At1g34110 [Pistacia vera]|uniref:probable LRR receptor-like serine/threonine-protein kinase At1g34110 n=1 Tax=Pistacia vera TaxID=55513 RepID=UPI001262F650|nr:probable LRR receptor-like serine/threonine-protein kinase At1g34110 [Pistacia vera]